MWHVCGTRPRYSALNMLGSTRLPAERDLPGEGRERRSKGCRRPATDTYSHTPHAAHLALPVSLGDGVLVRDLESLQADNKDERPGQFGSRVQPSMPNVQRTHALICSVVSCRASGQSTGVRSRRSGSIGCLASAPESGPSSPVCEGPVRAEPFAAPVSGGLVVAGLCAIRRVRLSRFRRSGASH